MVEELEREIVEGYVNELSELTSNAKPRINLLTMLADENQEYAVAIIRLIENQIFQVSKWRSFFRLDKFYVFVNFCKYFGIHIFSLFICVVSRFVILGKEKGERRTSPNELKSTKRAKGMEVLFQFYRSFIMIYN